MSKQTFYEKKGDNITWKKGDIYNDGSTILMVERIEERGVDVNVCLARKALCFFTLYPCLWCCLCPPLCYARHNNEEMLKNTALLVTDQGIIFYENEWTPQGTDCCSGALPGSQFNVPFDQLQDVRMDPQGWLETCCDNPGPGIQFFGSGVTGFTQQNSCYNSMLYQPFSLHEDMNRMLWQPFSLDEDMLRAKKEEIEKHWNTYRKNNKIEKEGGGGGGGMEMTEGVRKFCCDCGEKNEEMKKFCGGCGASLAN